jgi:hypothetical protein
LKVKLLFYSWRTPYWNISFIRWVVNKWNIHSKNIQVNGGLKTTYVLSIYAYYNHNMSNF